MLALLSSEASAAWTFDVRDVEIGNGTSSIRIIATSDGTDPAAFNVSDYIRQSKLAKFKGVPLYEIVTRTTTPPLATWAVVVTKDSQTIRSLSGLSIDDTVTESWAADSDTGYWSKMLEDITLDFGTASSGAVLRVDLIFW